MEKYALLIIDVQTALVERAPYHVAEVLRNIRALLERARANQTEVIYVRHEEGEGTSLESGTIGWGIAQDVAPVEGEKVVDKSYNSAFLETDLEEHLQQRGVTTLILVGMQSEYCIDATCKSAFERGYEVVIPRGATTTFDSAHLKAEEIIRFYEEDIWKGCFAQLPSVEEALKLIS